MILLSPGDEPAIRRIDALGVDRLHLLGYSEGGWIAGSHAALSAHRDRLASLTLVEPGGADEDDLKLPGPLDHFGGDREMPQRTGAAQRRRFR